MERIKNSFAGILIGLIMILAGGGLLVFNESNNVKNIKTVAEIREIAFDISSTYNSANDGELVSVTGDISIDEDVTDSAFGISLNAVSLKRVVEMYQWVEEVHTDSNDRKTYTYRAEWKTHLIDSSEFNQQTGHQNPTSMPYQGTSITSNQVTLGDFSLSEYQLNMFPQNQKYSNIGDVTLPDGYEVMDNYIIKGSLTSPAIGDVKITYMYAAPEKATVLAVQTSNRTLVDYISESEKSVNRVAEGEFTAQEMIDQLEDANNSLKWILRIGGAIAIMVGIALMLNPLAVMTDFIPFIGDLVGGAIAVFAILVGGAIALVIIAISWIVFRPLLGIGLLLLVVVLLFFAKSYAQNRAALRG